MNTAIEPGSCATPMPTGRLLKAYVAEARSEIKRYLRTPSFILPMLLFPAVFYLMFGVFMSFGPEGLMARYLLASYACFGIMGVGLFGFGVSLALERDGGLLTLKRALPMPPAAYLLGKMVMAMLCAVLVMVELLLLGHFAGQVVLGWGQVASLLVVSLIGVLPFCALGMLLGALIKGQGAPGFINLIYLPMAFLSGLWIPLQVMPDFIARLAPVFPSYHLNQVLLVAVGSSSKSIGLPVIVLALVTACCLALALWRLRRQG